jgi:hypothetical protein
MSHQVLRLGTRLTKLRAMSTTEVVSRVRYRLFLKRERREHKTRLQAGSDDIERFLVRSLRGPGWEQRLLAQRKGVSTARFMAGPHARDAMRALLQSPRFQVEREDSLKHAAATRTRRFEFFGQEFHYPTAIDWQKDPVSGRAWPAKYHADVPVHGGDLGCGDVKYVWELSRQQYLVDLAKAHVLTGDRRYLESLRDLVSSWMAGNPYGTGVNWSCALEPAFRLWSWLWAYYLTVDALDNDFHLEWLRGFHEHGRFLMRHLEYYSSPYNHLIGEAAALYTVGLCFPEFAESKAWQQRGRSVLEQRLPAQFYPDGGSVEQSTFYHHATTGFYLLAVLAARANGQDLSREVWNAIERGLEFSMTLVQPDGRTPEIGGADDGKPIRLEHLPFWDFRPYLSTGAVLFNRPDFKFVSGRFHEDSLWLLGPEGLKAFDELDATPPSQHATLLRSSGYAIARSDWSPAADYVCFDVGEQAAGMRPDAVPNSMHGHADCLSVVAWLGGRRVLVDSGLFAYNCGGVWESHFRETAAHNTAKVDGRDQARHIGKMAWSHSYRATVEDWKTADGGSATIASHDGYARGPEGVIHRRAVWLRPGGYLLICDEFTGRGHHDLEVNYQFAAGALDLVDGPRVVFDGAVEVAWAGDAEWQARLSHGGTEPAEGWICSSLGVRVPAPRLSLTGQMTGERSALITVLAPTGPGAPRVSVVDDGPGILIAVDGDNCTDWIAVRGLCTSSAIETDSLLAVCRLGADDRLEQHRVGGSVLQVNRDALERLRLSRAGRS